MFQTLNQLEEFIKLWFDPANTDVNPYTRERQPSDAVFDQLSLATRGSVALTRDTLYPDGSAASNIQTIKNWFQEIEMGSMANNTTIFGVHSMVVLLDQNFANGVYNYDLNTLSEQYSEFYSYIRQNRPASTRYNSFEVYIEQIMDLARDISRRLASDAIIGIIGDSNAEQATLVQVRTMMLDLLGFVASANYEVEQFEQEHANRCYPNSCRFGVTQEFFLDFDTEINNSSTDSEFTHRIQQDLRSLISSFYWRITRISDLPNINIASYLTVMMWELGGNATIQLIQKALRELHPTRNVPVTSQLTQTTLDLINKSDENEFLTKMQDYWVNIVLSRSISQPLYNLITLPRLYLIQQTGVRAEIASPIGVTNN